MCKDSNIRVVVSKGGMRTCEVVPADAEISEIIRLFLCCLGLVASPVEIHCAMKEVAKGYRDERDGVEPAVYPKVPRSPSDATNPWGDPYQHQETTVYSGEGMEPLSVRFGDTNTEGEDD